MRNITTVLEIISSISSTLAVDELVAEFVEKITQLVGADSCIVFQYQPEDDAIVILADYVSPEVTNPFENIRHVGAIYPLTHYPAITRVLRTQKPLVVYADESGPSEAEQGLLDAFQWQGMLLVPMLFNRQTIGLLSLFTILFIIGIGGFMLTWVKRNMNKPEE